ncbi:hypothetical protein TNCV_2675971 [Trichonephila clavipes]|nr:hypothetical protein TNCV_2675971 [Trichonephila clavipes]
MYSSALSIEIISDVEFSRRLVESRSDKLKQVKSCRKKQFNSPPQLENQSQCRRKTTQLVSRNETTQLNRRKQLNSSVGTKQLNSALPSTAYNRLQPPTTACNHLQPPTTACNRLQLPATAYNRLQPPAPPLQQNRLFLPTSLSCAKLCSVRHLAFYLVSNLDGLVDFKLLPTLKQHDGYWRQTS